MQSTATSRGIKRKCQDPECGRPFYDLNREQFSCPDCGTTFDLAAAARAMQSLQGRPSDRRGARVFPAPTAPVEKPEAVAEVADVDEIEEVATVEAGPEIGTDDTILEQDDDEDDVVDVEPAAKEQLDE